MAVTFGNFSHSMVEKPACATHLMRLEIVLVIVCDDSTAPLKAPGRVQKDSVIVVFQQTTLLKSHFKKRVVSLEVFGSSLVLDSHAGRTGVRINQFSLETFS